MTPMKTSELKENTAGMVSGIVRIPDSLSPFENDLSKYLYVI